MKKIGGLVCSSDYFLTSIVFSLKGTNNCILMQSIVSTEPRVIENWVCFLRESDLNEKSPNMRQNTDPWIINIYIYFKPGRIGFWGWPFSVIYAHWLLIVTLPQHERQTMNTFEVNLLMETWKKACEGQSLGGAASNCTLLKCLGYLKWNKTGFLSQSESSVIFGLNCAVVSSTTGNMKLSVDQCCNVALLLGCKSTESLKAL